MLIGYARVSTDEQNLAMQIDALRAAGCEVIHEDKASGVLNGRKGMAEALKGCAAGDVLVVWKLDRLARSLHDLVVIAEDLKGRSVGLKILTGEGAAVDTTHPQGRMVFGILAVMAEFERELMSERTVAGMVAAKRRGRHIGRPPKLGPDQLDMATQLIAGDRSQKEVAKALGVGFSTLRRALKLRLGQRAAMGRGRRTSPPRPPVGPPADAEEGALRVRALLGEDIRPERRHGGRLWPTLR